MNFENQLQPEIALNGRLKKYGIKFLEDGSIFGPTRPKEFGKTPEFLFKETEKKLLDDEKVFLKKHFTGEFSTVEYQSDVLRVTDAIVREIIGKSFHEFTNIIFMSKEDFTEYAKVTAPHLAKKWKITGDFHGISLGGLVLMQDTGGSNCFPFLFHEIGHALYEVHENNYLNELRAFYFSILCIKKLEKELKKIGVGAYYADDYYKDWQLPSLDHKKACADARTLFAFQTHYDILVQGKDENEKTEQELLKKVKQNKKSF